MNPYSDPQAEAVLLASVLTCPDAYDHAMALGLIPEDFSLDQNRRLFGAIVQLGEEGQPIAFETVLSELGKRPGAELLFPVLEDLTSPLHVPRNNVKWHVDRLRDLAKRRSVVALCKQTVALADDVGEKTSGCFERLEQGLVDIQAQGSSGRRTLVKEFLGDVIQEIESRSRKTGLTGLPTGIPDLDEATTGVQQGELVVIGATPGCGKTALGTQIALATAKSGIPVAIFSLEMTQRELGARFFANESAISASRLRNPSFIAKDQWAELARCSEHLCQLPIHVDDSSTLTIYELVARARRFIRQHQCGLIVVDYIRLIKAPGKEHREQVGNATDALRQLAKKEKVGVIALSQLARPVGKNSNTRPSMLRLKESGDIEAHAHIVLLIHMPTKGGKPTGEDEIIIAKNRHGPIGTIDVTFSRERLKFLPRLVEAGE